ncbi:hypothetical protein AOCH_006002 [Aspergillus ochraceoroseus]|uniref:Uncharacterized protein n=1 Tax=Aspergillus ochraceoroseus TaxID=138278 RepID=A0A0F8XLL3_9EURO|nr:hypothetical protein AOCH_006002 [Aspergillus ochraceoroseus]
MTSMVETSWPPKSPRDALLSSPSGRRKYEEMQRRRENLGSPLKHSTTTPDLRTKAAQLLSDGLDDTEDDDEDEETLHLKLAAIEARLKLKQLQRNRGKAGTGRPDRHEGGDAPSRPASSGGFSSRIQDQPARNKGPRETNSRIQPGEVQVPLSPTRRVPALAEPASPRRYLLGIDKGLKGSDISLRRPPSSRGANSRPTSRLGSRDGPTAHTGSTRITEKSRREREARAERIQASRSSAFQYDQTEMEAFKAAAAERPNSPPKLHTRTGRAESFNRDDVLRSYNNLKPSLKRSNTTPSLRKPEGDEMKESRSHIPKRSQKSESTSFSPQPGSSRLNSFNSDEASGEKEGALEKAPDSSKFEPFSSLHLSNRILPHSFLDRTLEDKKVLRIPDLLRMIKGPPFELPDDIDGDYVVFGIVASKSEPKLVKETKNVTAKETNPFDDGLNNTSQYMVITLTDLKWTIDLFLFDTAFPRYYRLSEGILIAILNPTILPPPKNKTDTNRFSLSISSSDDKILEVGYAQDIGFCKAVRKDGKTCQSWVDGRKTEFCDFHVDLQVRRTQAGRMGVNGGTGMFGPGGRSGSRTGFYGGGKRGTQPKGNGLLRADGAQYDPQSGSLYYVAPSFKSRSNGGSSFQHLLPGQSAASLIDADHDDPFIAAGMMARGADSKEERFRKRLVEQQRERELTQKLTSRSGGVGAEYLRARNDENIPTTTHRPGMGPAHKAHHHKMHSSDSTVPSSSAVNATPLSFAGFKRADTVRLSPKKRAHDGDRPNGSGVKKTRFITSNGIKEAGRDSLGGNPNAVAQRTTYDDDDDDDDGLEII